MAELPENYVDPILDETVNTKKRYSIVENEDGTYTIEDVTTYTQEASRINALAFNNQNTEINGKIDVANILSTLEEVEENEVLGRVVDATVVKGISDIIEPLTYTGAGAHNSIYRGKSLGTSVTSEQYANIANGTFKDMYIGDYWTISGKVYRIAAFDYYYRCGDTDLTTHHVTLVPDKALYTAQMHKTESGQYESGAANTTEGGYVGSDMYTTNLESAKTTIAAAFGDHLLEHKQYLVNAVTSGRPSGAAWLSSKVELMNEIMVYGTNVFSPVSDGSTVPTVHTVCKTQLPLFALRPDAINFRESYWLRDVVSAATFARVYTGGYATGNSASYPFGVRPAFSIS